MLTGALDTTFNAPNGFLMHDQANGSSVSEIGNSVFHDANNNIIVAGTSYSSPYDGVIWKYSANGSLDASFSGDGIAIAPRETGTTNHYFTNVTSDSAGNLYATGSSYDGSTWNVSVWAFDSNGDVRTDFSTDGIASGKILIAGKSLNTTTVYDAVIWRLNADGSLDTSFCGTGYCVFDSISGAVNKDDTLKSIIIDNNGKIVVTGYAGGDTRGNPFVMRLNTNGSVDSTFGSSGIAVLDSTFSTVAGVVIDSNNKQLVAGSYAGSAVAWRLNTDGSFDTSFATGGYFFNNSDTTAQVVMGIAISVTDELLLSGCYNCTTIAADHDVAVWKLTTDGALDSNFGTAGLFSFETTGVSLQDEGHAISLDSSGHAVISGYSNNGTNMDMALWRLQ